MEKVDFSLVLCGLQNGLVVPALLSCCWVNKEIATCLQTVCSCVYR